VAYLNVKEDLQANEEWAKNVAYWSCGLPYQEILKAEFSIMETVRNILSFQHCQQRAKFFISCTDLWLTVC